MPSIKQISCVSKKPHNCYTVAEKIVFISMLSVLQDNWMSKASAAKELHTPLRNFKKSTKKAFIQLDECSSPLWSRSPTWSYFQGCSTQFHFWELQTNSSNILSMAIHVSSLSGTWSAGPPQDSLKNGAMFTTWVCINLSVILMRWGWHMTIDGNVTLNSFST